MLSIFSSSLPFTESKNVLSSFFEVEVVPKPSLTHPFLKHPFSCLNALVKIKLTCIHLKHVKRKLLLKKNNSFFVRDFKFFIDYSFGALYCYQKIGCFKTALGTIQFFIFNHWDLGEFFNFFGGFFVIFENVWKAHLALVHFPNPHFALLAFSFDDVNYYFYKVKFEGMTRPRGG